MPLGDRPHHGFVETRKFRPIGSAQEALEFHAMGRPQAGYRRHQAMARSAISRRLFADFRRSPSAPSHDPPRLRRHHQGLHGASSPTAPDPRPGHLGALASKPVMAGRPFCSAFAYVDSIALEVDTRMSTNSSTACAISAFLLRHQPRGHQGPDCCHHRAGLRD